ncbi:MAG TPA: zinc ribbon domain-containing protein, partial [Thermoplasmata archaeon]|nr:zinc ribbon domain-containing protein [Thermoplasmata archaeon]
IFEVILVGVGALFLIVPFLGAIILGFALIGFVWIALIWVFSYQRVNDGDYEGARTPTLVFAILSLITLSLIPGILFLIAYVKLGDAIREGAATTPAWGAPPPAPPLSPSPAPAGAGRFCSHCGRANPGTGAYCLGCGAPLG